MFMKPKVKRIIAREGLIIISIILLAGAIYCLGLMLINQEKLYKANVQEILPVALKDKPSALEFLKNKGKPYIFDLLDPSANIIRFPKKTKDEVIKQTIMRDFHHFKLDDYFTLDSPRGTNISASYNDKGQRVFNSIIYKIDWRLASILILFFTYPLYWIIRFVIWAIGTLKEKVEN